MILLYCNMADFQMNLPTVHLAFLYDHLTVHSKQNPKTCQTFHCERRK